MASILDLQQFAAQDIAMNQSPLAIIGRAMGEEVARRNKQREEQKALQLEKQIEKQIDMDLLQKKFEYEQQQQLEKEAREEKERARQLALVKEYRDLQYQREEEQRRNRQLEEEKNLQLKQQMAIKLLQEEAAIEQKKEIEKAVRVSQEQEREFNIYKQFKSMDDRTVSGDTKRFIEGGKAKELERKARVISREKITPKYDIISGKASVTIEDKSPIEILQEEIAYGFYNTPQEIVKRGMELGADANKLEALATTAAIPGVIGDTQIPTQQVTQQIPAGMRQRGMKYDKFGNLVSEGFEPIPEKKPPTQAQETTALYASRIKQSNDIFDQLENYINNQGVMEAAQGALPDFANFMKSGDMQSYQQAQKNFLNAVLRRESGAVISPSEFANGRQQYFPQPGDKPAVLKQKKENRDLVMKNFIKSAGDAYVPYEGTDTIGKYTEFKSESEALSANLPKGTIVIINGRKARID